MRKSMTMILALAVSFLLLTTVKAAENLGKLGEAYNERIGLMTEGEQEQQKLQALYEGDELGYHLTGFTMGNESSVGIMGPEGRIVYEKQEGDRILFYANGLFISQDDADMYLKNIDGEILFSASGLGVTGFGMIDDTLRNAKFLKDGYVMVYSMEESLSGVSYALGVVDTEGNWVRELSNEMPILTSGAEIKSDLIEKKLIYAGDGCVLVPAGSKEKDYKYAYRIYDLNTDTCSDFSVVEGEVSKSLLNDLAENCQFEEGRYVKRRDKNLYTFSSDGSVKQEVMMTKEISSGLSDYFGSHYGEDGTVLSLVRTSKVNAIIDQNGILREFDFKIVAGFPTENGWMFAAENGEGTHYYGAMDQQGAFLMEPVKTEAVCLLFTDGQMLEYNHKADQEKGPKVILDLDGNVLYEGQDENKTLELRNGIIYEHRKREGTYTVLPISS